MNARRIALLLLVVSAVELVVILRLANRQNPPPIQLPGETVSRVTPAKIQTQTITRTNRFDWRSVESSDYRAYIDNLRSTGCPEETVRDIIIADIDKMFAARVRSLTDQPSDANTYWLPLQDEFSQETNARLEREQQKLEQEKKELIKALLGADLVAERRKAEGREDVIDQRLSFLPGEKRDKLRTVLDKFSERETAILQNRNDEGGVLTAEDRAQLQKLRQDRDVEMSAILTPDERKLYDYWTSSAGVAARYALAGLENPTEQEFQAIYRIQKEFDDKLDPALTDANDSPAAWRSAREELLRKMRAALGDQRFAEYERAQDMDYRNVLDVAARLQLPKESATDIYELKMSIHDEIEKIFNDVQLNEQQRELMASQVRKQAGRKVQEILGMTGFKRYLNQGNTGWFEVE